MNTTQYFAMLLLAVILIGAKGDSVPNFKLRNLQNKQVELAQLLKQGPVLLDFWATWCKPCIKALPKLNELHEKYHEDGLMVVGINEDGSRSQAKVKPFVHSFKVKFAILIDNNNDVMRKLQVRSLPTTILLSPAGNVVVRKTGFSIDGMRKLEETIQALLKEYPGD